MDNKSDKYKLRRFEWDKEPDKYKIRGFETREKYLQYLGTEFGVPEETVYKLADMFGPSKDFDSLPRAVASYAHTKRILMYGC